MKFISATINILIMVTFVYWTLADLECGKLQLGQVYNENAITQLDEHPWIGRLYATDSDKLDYRCNAVLVSRRHLLGAAHCFWGSRNQPQIVILGDSNYGNNNTEPDCDTSGFCAPLLKQYKIQDIAIHPNYDYAKHRNNIAIVHLTQEVELSHYIQPICLPPQSVYATNLYGQYLIYAGYVTDLFGPPQTEKLKTVAHIVPWEYCNNMIDSNVSSYNDICASYIGNFFFYSGSPLMAIDIDIANLKLNNYYLVGVSTYISLPLDGSVDVFARMASYINWINTNIKHSYN